MSSLQKAIELIQAGNRQSGKQILAEILAREPANESAWLWLSACVDSDDQRRYCLQQILKENPNHPLARSALASLSPAATEPPVEHPEPFPAPPQQSAEEQDAEWEQDTPSEPLADGDDWQSLANEVDPENWASPPPPMPGEGAALVLRGLSRHEVKDLNNWVVRQLSKHTSFNDIVLYVCERSGVSWPEAEAFVRDVEAKARPAIARRQSPILIAVGAITLIIGLVLAYDSAAYFAGLVANLSQVSQDPLPYLMAAPYFVRRLIFLALGTGMIVGGLWGILRAAKPAAEGPLIPSGQADSSGKGYESIDDAVDVGAWLGGRSSSQSGKSRHGGTRPF